MLRVKMFLDSQYVQPVGYRLHQRDDPKRGFASHNARGF
jgi:hypothetical protein